MKRFAWLFLLLAGLGLPALGQTTTAYTGVIQDLAGNPVTSGQVTFTLNPSTDSTLSGTARFVPSTITCTINGDGTFSAQAGGQCTVRRNTAISPSGTAYRICIQAAFRTPGSCFYDYATTASKDISTIVPTLATGPIDYSGQAPTYGYGVPLASSCTGSAVGTYIQRDAPVGANVWGCINGTWVQQNGLGWNGHSFTIPTDGFLTAPAGSLGGQVVLPSGSAAAAAQVYTQLSSYSNVSGAGFYINQAGVGWSGADGFYPSLDVNVRSISQMQSTFLNKHAIGDASGGSKYISADGGLVAAGDEGVQGSAIYGGQTQGSGQNYPNGYGRFLSGSTGTGVTLPSLTYESGINSTSDGSQLLDISASTLHGSLNGASSAFAPVDSNGTALTAYANVLPTTGMINPATNGSVTLPPLTAMAYCSATVAPTGLTADRTVTNATPYTCTLAKIGGTVGGHALTTGYVAVDGANFYDPTTITAVGTPTGSPVTQTVTLGLSLPNNGFWLFQGGGAGQAISFTADYMLSAGQNLVPIGQTALTFSANATAGSRTLTGVATTGGSLVVGGAVIGCLTGGTVVTSISGSTVGISLPAPSTASLSECQEGMSHVRTHYHFLGSVDGVGAIYDAFAVGGLHVVLPQAGQQAELTTGASALIDIFPATQIVANLAKVNSSPQMPQLKAGNNVAFSAGDLIESPFYYFFGGVPQEIIWTRDTPSPPGYATNLGGGQEKQSGTSFTAGQSGHMTLNFAPCSQYKACGGPLDPPDAYQALSGGSAWGNLWYSDRTPSAGYSMLKALFTPTGTYTAADNFFLGNLPSSTIYYDIPSGSMTASGIVSTYSPRWGSGISTAGVPTLSAYMQFRSATGGYFGIHNNTGSAVNVVPANSALPFLLMNLDGTLCTVQTTGGSVGSVGNCFGGYGGAPMQSIWQDTMFWGPNGSPKASLTPAGVATFVNVATNKYTVSTLPAAGSLAAGTMVVVTDASSYTPGTCTGGGTLYMIAVTNGTIWSCH